MKFITIEKKNGKNKPLTITRDIQKEVRTFRKLLKDMLDFDDIPQDYKRGIRLVLELEAYDLNILIGFYDICDCRLSDLARLLNISPSVCSNRLNKIIKKIKSQL